MKTYSNKIFSFFKHVMGHELTIHLSCSKLTTSILNLRLTTKSSFEL